MLDRIKDVLRKQSKRRLACLAAVILVVSMGLTASARTWLSSRGAVVKSMPLSMSMPNNATGQEQGVIRLLTSGFNPGEVSGAAGQYRIVATRTSKDEPVVLQFKRESGELVQEIVMPLEKVDWTTLVELESGSYMLGVSNHPQWTCHITVQ